MKYYIILLVLESIIESVLPSLLEVQYYTILQVLEVQYYRILSVLDSILKPVLQSVIEVQSILNHLTMDY